MNGKVCHAFGIRIRIVDVLTLIQLQLFFATQAIFSCIYSLLFLFHYGMTNQIKILLFYQIFNQSLLVDRFFSSSMWVMIIIDWNKNSEKYCPCMCDACTQQWTVSWSAHKCNVTVSMTEQWLIRNNNHNHNHNSKLIIIASEWLVLCCIYIQIPSIVLFVRELFL